MDRLKLSHIDEDLESSEVAALCFLCRDVVNRKRLEGIENAKALFLRLEEKGVLDPSFLSELLQTIQRKDLLSHLETDSRPPADSRPPVGAQTLTPYRVMLYKIYEDITKENLERMKFLLSSDLGKRQIDTCNTALDVFAEMEKTGLLSDTRLGLDKLHMVLLEMDRELAGVVNQYIREATHQPQTPSAPHVSMDNQRVNNIAQPTQTTLPITETRPSNERVIYSDSEPASLHDQTDYYALTHNPRGLCVVINNEIFLEIEMKNRGGTQQDEKVLHSVFSLLGFEVVVHNNLTAESIRCELRKLSKRNFSNEDALVVCVLSHGEIGCVFGTDEKKVTLTEMTQLFTSNLAPTLAGKPKLFFIQACQGTGYQRGATPCPPRPSHEQGDRQSRLEEDAGPVRGETIPWGADFLLGMATVQECKSFRNTSTGSIYIQELCRQLKRSAGSPEKDDILTVLTRVNREVSKGEYLSYKQMPEPKYTLTKKLVLRYV